jgi:hypothetical protein
LNNDNIHKIVDNYNKKNKIDMDDVPIK